MIAILSSHEDREQRQEFLNLIEKALGHPLDQHTFERLYEIQKTLRHNQGSLVDDFDQRRISQADYLERLNSLLAATMAANRTLLGDERFMKIFGEAGLHPEGLVDPQIFYDTHGGRKFLMPNL